MAIPARHIYKYITNFYNSKSVALLRDVVAYDLQMDNTQDAYIYIRVCPWRSPLVSFST